MPIYEYRCESCGHTLDALQKIADAPLTDCPDCDEATLKRLMSAPSFRLKGAGWYETDFKSDQERKRNLAERPDGQAKEGKPQEDKQASGDKASGEKASAEPVSGKKKPASDSDSAKKPAKSAASGSGTEAA